MLNNNPNGNGNGNNNGNGTGVALLRLNEISFPKKVGIIYSYVKREYFPTEEQYVTEKDALHDAEIIATYLERLGITAHLYPATPELSAALIKDKPEMVFNLIGSILGQEFLIATISGILEMHEIPYTGAGILGMSMDHNKFLVKKLMQQHGIPVPYYQLFPTANSVLDPHIRFPLISKLNAIHGAVELNEDAISQNEKELRDRLRFLTQTYDQSVIAEEFIVGKEITAMLLEGLNKKVYLAQKVFNDRNNPYAFATFDAQWGKNTNSFVYEKYTDPELVNLVKKAFDVVKMADYGKFDIRIDAAGRYYFIDSNCNPAFGPKETDCAIANILDLYGVSFNEILKRMIINTMRDAANKPLLPAP
jgi:D-alanine-D-alanine ligase